MSNSNQPTDQPKRKQKLRNKPKRKRLPLYHVVLWNDDEHTYDYVIRMMKDLFGHQQETGFLIASAVDHSGKAIVFTTHLELAEMKRDQIHAYGIDDLMEGKCSGSMLATIEKAETE